MTRLRGLVFITLPAIAIQLIVMALIASPAPALEATVPASITIATGLFLTAENALKATSQLGAKGRTAYIKKIEIKGRDIYVVMEISSARSAEDFAPTAASLPADESRKFQLVATLASENAANAALRRFSQQGMRAFIVRSGQAGSAKAPGYSIVLDTRTISSPPPPPPPIDAGLMVPGVAAIRRPAPSVASAPKTPAPLKEKHSTFSFEYELNAYYTSADLFISLTNAPIPDAGEKSEFQIYRDLLMDSYVPRFIVLEASINPLPLIGVALRNSAPEIYKDGEVGDDLNLWQAVTEGFEEPWAISLFMGNVMNFKRAGSPAYEGGNKGFIGYLLSVGNLHIKDNKLINDFWQELEWKVKGDRDYPLNRLSWSFRVGAKFHEHPDITDVLYLSVRRSRLDFKKESSGIFHNSGIEYTFLFDQKTLSAVQHTFFVEKKFPLKNKKLAYTLALGFIYDKDRKYTGDLDDRDGDSFSLIIRPNIEF